ncbi:uncharacterized protein [Montipora capricornis]|uniref:uncharacterized protein n=1 Tax=Montipora capricornis TaxID=246305 RepID=UPI0035F11F5E
MGNRSSTSEKYGMPTSRYSRYEGAGIGSYTHCGQGGDRRPDKSVYIGRKRLTEQFPRKFRVPEITVPTLDQVLLKTCGNEGQHRDLSEEEKATLEFLKAAITFVPSALDAGANMRNASFLFSQPGREFAITAGKGDWEFYFSQDDKGDIFGHCVRKPRLRYIWDRFKSTVRSVRPYLLPILGPPFLALVAA